MKVEIMIYFYGAVCASMIVFNLVYNLLLKGNEPRMQRRCVKIKAQLDRQISLLQAGKNIEHAHLDYLCRYLCHVNHLMAFHQALQKQFQQDSELYQEYLRQIRPAILYAATIYQDKEDMQAGYFTYFLSCYTTSRYLAMDSLQNILLDYVKKTNLYCRFNALKALYHFASPEHIVDAIKLQDDKKVFLHEKLITEGLLSYQGDHDRLITLFWSQFSSFTVHSQLAILNYIRFRSGAYQKEMYAIMMHPAADKELRLAAIRYFGKYYYEPACKPMLDFVKDKNATWWEFATVAASSLATYSRAEVVSVLKEALHSSNWYIRYSSAQSLEHLNVDYSDMIDIAAGNDRYAREMMTYRLKARTLQSPGGVPWDDGYI